MPRNPKSKKLGWKDSVADNRKPEPTYKKGDRVREAVRRLAERRPRVVIPTNEQVAEQSDREAMEEYNSIIEENEG